MNNYDSKLVLRETPFVLWFIALIFSGVGLLMAFEGGPPLVLRLSLSASE